MCGAIGLICPICLHGVDMDSSHSLSFTHATAVLTFDAGAIPTPFKKGFRILCGRLDRFLRLDQYLTYVT